MSTLRTMPRRNQAEANGNGGGLQTKPPEISAKPLTESHAGSTRAPDGECSDRWAASPKTEPTKSNGAPT